MYVGPGFRRGMRGMRGMGGLCLLNPADGQMEDSDTGAPCSNVTTGLTPIAAPALALPCLAGSGPLQPGQAYCYGNAPSGLLPVAGTPAPVIVSGGSSNTVMIGLAVAAVALLFLGLGKR
jgi:hypothetical protein